MMRVSIIIPTLNETASLPKTLAAIKSSAPQVEVIVVDGGSTDQTLDIAASHGAIVCSAPLGRGAQMNYGATVAGGDTLLFLHADTILPFSFLQEIESLLALPDISAGAFTLGLDTSSWVLRIIEGAANIRSRYWQLPFGDQALFMRASVFRELGGYKAIPILEDVELVTRLKGRGKVVVSKERVLTSARRWHEQGVWWTTARNQLTLIAYRLGFSPETIARIYRRSQPQVEREESCLSVSREARVDVNSAHG